MSDDKGTIARLLLTSSGLVFAGMAFQLGVNFLTKLVMARTLSRSMYGTVTLGLTLMTTLSILVLLGSDTGVARFLPRFDDPSHRRGILLTAFKTILPLSVVASVSVVVFADAIATRVFQDPSIAGTIRVFGLVVPLSAFVRLTVGSARGMKKALPRVYLRNVGLPIVQFVSVMVVLSLGLQSVGVAWAYSFAYAVVSLLALYYLYEQTPLFDSVPSVPMYRELLLFSLPLMVTAAMNLVLANVDIFMIGAFKSTDAVGVYNVVYPLARLLNTILVAFSFLFIPVISELHSEGRASEMTRIYRVVSKWTFVTTLPIALVFVLYPDVVIRGTFGAKYADGGLALSVLAVGFLTHAIAGPSGDMLTSIGDTRLIMYDNVFVAGFNFALNLVLIPRFSFLGAAVATTAGYAVMNALYLTQLYRRLGTHPFRSALLVPALVATAFWVLVYAALHSLQLVSGPALLLAGIVFVPVYVALIFAFGAVDEAEIELAKNAAERAGISLDRFE